MLRQVAVLLVLQLVLADVLPSETTHPVEYGSNRFKCDTAGGAYSTQPLKSSDGILTDALCLQLVYTLRVEREFNLLFFNPDNKVHLPIIGGSCYMEVNVNDSKVIEVIQSLPDLQCSKPMLSPKGLGTAFVTIHDHGFYPPLAAAAVVQVADIDWIKTTPLEEMSLMEETSQFIELFAGTNDGNTFDHSQYSFMNIQLHMEDKIIELVERDSFLSPSSGYITTSRFKIVGRSPGVTIVYVSARQQSGHRITSRPLKVEVYAIPRIHPQKVFLVPGASYTLMLKGGPPTGSYVEFTSRDNGIATIHKSSGRLYAASPGNTTLIAEVYGNEDVVIYQAYGSLEVGIPSSLMLNIQSEQLGVGHDMPIYPLFLEGNLFSFYELCNNYRWTIKDEKVLSFSVMEHFVKDKSADTVTASKEIQASGFINVLHGRSAGRTNVAVSFSCDFISSSYAHSKAYSASVWLSVVPDVLVALGGVRTWVLPPHYTTSSLLPSSLESCGLDIHHKGAISYSLLGSCDYISIDGDRVKTTESNNFACIQANDCCTGRIGIATCIRVAEVSQIRITLPLHVIDLAVGAELDLPINYYDVLGYPFHEAYNVIPVYAETNFPDIVSINGIHDGHGNISLRLKAICNGRALLRISMNNNPQKSDYLLVTVGSYPQNRVLGVIIEDISVDAPKHVLTNAPFPARGYNFSVKLSDSYGKKVGALGNEEGVPYDCRLDPPYVGDVKPWMDVDTGNFYCLFFPNSPEHLAHSVPPLSDMKPDGFISISASLREATNISGSARAYFVGGFSILGMIQESMVLNLTPDSHPTSITLVGNTDVDIYLHGQDLIKVSPVERGNFRIVYEVKVLQARSFSDKIIIRLEVNGQRAEIDVNFELEVASGVNFWEKPDFEMWVTICFDIYALLVLCIIVIVMV